MPSIVITLGQDGKPCGLSKEDQAQYERWRRRVMEMEPGETLQFSWAAPRSPAFHRRYFLMLNWIFENQETYRCQEEMRKWAERGARHVEVMDGPEGMKFEIAKSISYDDLDDDAFKALCMRVRAFLLTTEALLKLWPHAPIAHSFEAMRHLLEEGL